MLFRSIDEVEGGPALFSQLGLPRPLFAQMTCDQVGCVRRGEWEYGLAFDGTITRIVPGRAYWVRLEADLSDLQPGPAPLDQIGGAVFDMVDDGYVIEELDDGSAILHLYSSYRVTTRINWYAGWWLDRLMADIQGYILRVERVRSEAAG